MILAHSFLELHLVFMQPSCEEGHSGEIANWAGVIKNCLQGRMEVFKQGSAQKWRGPPRKYSRGIRAQVVLRDSCTGQFNPSEEQKYFPVTRDTEETATLKNLLDKCVKIWNEANWLKNCNQWSSEIAPYIANPDSLKKSHKDAQLRNKMNWWRAQAECPCFHRWRRLWLIFHHSKTLGIKKITGIEMAAYCHMTSIAL